MHFRYGQKSNGEWGIRVSPDHLRPADPPYPVRYVDEAIGGDDWIIPYNLDYVCSIVFCTRPANASIIFVGPGSRPSDPPPGQGGEPVPVFTFASEADVVVPEVNSWIWDEPEIVLEFPEGRRLVVNGDLFAENVTLTEIA